MSAPEGSRAVRAAGTIDASVHPSVRPVPVAKEMRWAVLSRMLTPGDSVLEIGARDGVMSIRLREYFRQVTALDLDLLPWQIDGIEFVQGDVRRLTFHDGQFDCVVCSEVLEHIDAVETAASELERVTRPGGSLVVSVPYRQDLRIGRTLCVTCGTANPPYGHLHSFDEKRLASLFPGCDVERTELAGETREKTTGVSQWLMHVAGHPWGVYQQHEPCIHCGAEIRQPKERALWKRVASAAASRIDSVAGRLASTKALWVTMMLRKRS